MKEIVRRRIIFKKDKTGYLAHMIMNGYQIYDRETILHEHFPLGHCKDKELEKMIEFFSSCNYDIEIMEEIK